MWHRTLKNIEWIGAVSVRLKIEAATTLAETLVSWANFLCINSLLITSVQDSCYHLSDGTRSLNMTQYSQVVTRELEVKVKPHPYAFDFEVTIF